MKNKTYITKMHDLEIRTELKRCKVKTLKFQEI